MSNQDTRALVLIKGVVDDCSIDVVESMRQIRDLAGVDATGWRDARMHNATERLRDVVRVLEGLQDAPAEPDPIAELEKLGGQLRHGADGIELYVAVAGAFYEESTGDSKPSLSDIRAAAARLLARIGGAK